MAKEVAIGKRLKISQAQQYMLLSVLGASMVLGIAAALTINFVKKIAFNITVISEKNQSIDMYSDTIKNVGICKKPSGKIYSEDELRKCNPNAVEISDIPGTLRSEILEKLAASWTLNAVPREEQSACINPETKKNYTYGELNAIYDAAEGDEALVKASNLIKSCSALRIIPDALPAFRNEEALLSSLNKIFIMSGWQPKSLSPSDSKSDDSLRKVQPVAKNIAVNLSVEGNSETTLKVLKNIEQSIREFNIRVATVEWGSADTLDIKAQAEAYYVDPARLVEVQKVIEGAKKK